MAARARHDDTEGFKIRTRDRKPDDLSSNAYSGKVDRRRGDDRRGAKRARRRDDQQRDHAIVEQLMAEKARLEHVLVKAEEVYAKWSNRSRLDGVMREMDQAIIRTRD